MITTLLAYLVTIAILVVFHELGHYWIARLCGVKVLRFSVGFGTIIWSRRFGRDQTEWAISAIPLGGYVKMLDEREGEVAAHELPRAFTQKPVLQRIAIVVAGPFANLLLAVLLYAGLFMHGMNSVKPELGEVPARTPAAEAGLQRGEVLVRLDGDAVDNWDDVFRTMLNLVLSHRMVPVEVRTPDGTLLTRQLDMRSLAPSELNRDFMAKLGLQPLPFPPVLGKVMEGGAGARAGLREGDLVRGINGHAISGPDEMVREVKSHPDAALQFDIVRDGKPLAVTVTPASVAEEGKPVGKINVEVRSNVPVTRFSYTPMESVTKALRTTRQYGVLSVRAIASIVTGDISLRNLRGPITTAQGAGASARAGFVPYLWFLAFISVSLGVMNILPIPILDGGHLMYYIAEFFKGAPVSERAWEIGQMIGVALIAALMSIALYNEISGLLLGQPLQ